MEPDVRLMGIGTAKLLQDLRRTGLPLFPEPLSSRYVSAFQAWLLAASFRSSSAGIQVTEREALAFSEAIKSQSR